MPLRRVRIRSVVLLAGLCLATPVRAETFLAEVGEYHAHVIRLEVTRTF